jgi:uncharacterized membrane protein
MSKYWKFTNRILFTLALVALPAINFFTGSELAGNLANFVLALLIVLLCMGIGTTLDESTKAASGSLSEEKLVKFVETFRPLDDIEQTLFKLSRAAWVVGLLVMAACGYEWFAGFILVTWLFWVTSMSIARDRADALRSNVSKAA